MLGVIRTCGKEHVHLDVCLVSGGGSWTQVVEIRACRNLSLALSVWPCCLNLFPEERNEKIQEIVIFTHVPPHNG